VINTRIVSHSCGRVFDIASIAAVANSGDSVLQGGVLEHDGYFTVGLSLEQNRLAI